MSDNQSSSLKSYVDSAVGAGQSALGSLTGNTGHQAEGDAKKDQAATEKEASNTFGKLGPVAASGSGGVSFDDPRRQEGSYNQTMGSAKETIGGLFGAEGLKKEGQQQNAEGKGMEAEGQLADFGSGMKDRVQGTLGGMAAGITGDREAQQKHQLQHDDGKTQLRSAQADIQKQADA
ncbi:hypothetical protein OEA41_000685 [Lepraria neglecta]|uniref:CsbD-like domain-containing protein n=1 Tax=Lepraria neglecta TaxID=209136 RepID=A0AAD9ZH25_9LECA|nr:hypothetical protein OEA41_000685 [Lepraria neglecta]